MTVTMEAESDIVVVVSTTADPSQRERRDKAKEDKRRRRNQKWRESQRRKQRRKQEKKCKKRRERNWKLRETKRKKDKAVKIASLQDFARSGVPQGKAVVEISTNGESGISTELTLDSFEGSFSLPVFGKLPVKEFLSLFKFFDLGGKKLGDMMKGGVKDGRMDRRSRQLPSVNVRRRVKKQRSKECGHSALYNSIFLGEDYKEAPKAEEMYMAADRLNLAFRGSNKLSCGSRDAGGQFSIEAIQTALQAKHSNTYGVHRMSGAHARRLAKQTSGNFVALVYLKESKTLGWQTHWIAVRELDGKMVIIDGASRACFLLSESALKQHYADVVRVYRITKQV